MRFALVLTPDGDLTKITMPADPDESLAALNTAIGSRLVDVVRLTSTIDMWLDDEGLYTQSFNPFATALAHNFGYVWQPYHGPVVLASFDADGNTIGLTLDQMRGVLTRLYDVAS